MSTPAAFYSQVMDTMERMTDQILALQALSGLLAGCQRNEVAPAELTYLLDPIIDKQKALVDELMDTEKPVAHSPSRPSHKSKPVLVAGNK
ncbi:hypothetical protein [Methylomicrobium lacus]|uniref:hypothetical protein n=1 Tax=Methylomicrobium lacus TaxID=136992 RepID=UPI00045EB888|nr:hypothetical protein [Methylomicrobium lacus]